MGVGHQGHQDAETPRFQHRVIWGNEARSSRGHEGSRRLLLGLGNDPGVRGGFFCWPMDRRGRVVGWRRGNEEWSCRRLGSSDFWLLILWGIAGCGLTWTRCVSYSWVGGARVFFIGDLRRRDSRRSCAIARSKAPEARKAFPMAGRENNFRGA